MITAGAVKSLKLRRQDDPIAVVGWTAEMIHVVVNATDPSETDSLRTFSPSRGIKTEHRSARPRRRLGVTRCPAMWAYPGLSCGRGLQPRASQLTRRQNWRHPGDRRQQSTQVLPLTLTAIGVVYGDIGTSPLYALRECFFGSHSVPPTHENVLGVLSLIFCSLLIVISVKYIAFVMRADNQGEGGILALTALLPSRAGNGPRWPALMLMGIFGAALLYGDGMITPAISVLGAVEGLRSRRRCSSPYVVPIAVAILIGVFAVQRHGTHRVGRFRSDHGGVVSS